MVITKEQLKEYLEGKWDVTFDQITEDLKLTENEFPKIKEYLEQLEKEGWIRKSFCQQHNTDEYDPAEEQGYYWT